MAAAAGTDPGSVDVSVAAGSVLITIVIRAPTAAAATAAGDAIADEVADAASATAFLEDVGSGISIAVSGYAMGIEAGPMWHPPVAAANVPRSMQRGSSVEPIVADGPDEDDEEVRA